MGLEDYMVSYAKPRVNFTLGVALFLVITATLSFCVSLCYHWRRMSARMTANGTAAPPAAAASAATAHVYFSDLASLNFLTYAASQIHGSTTPISPDAKQPNINITVLETNSNLFPVLMPGDKIPTFLAWPRPLIMNHVQLSVEPAQPGAINVDQIACTIITVPQQTPPEITINIDTADIQTNTSDFDLDHSTPPAHPSV